MPNHQEQRFSLLLQGYLENSLSNAELDEFFELVKDPQYRSQLSANVLKSLQQHQPVSGNTEDAFARFSRAIEEESRSSSGVRSMSFYWKRFAAAAVILFAVSTAWYFLSRPAKNNTAQSSSKTLKNDIAPGTKRAMITLADGSKILLDSLHDGLIADQGAAKLHQTDGAIVYSTDDDNSTGLEYNIMSTGAGEESPALVLEDGTRVWLNAKSSLKFPVAFRGAERKVEITGEAYFEVSHNASKPFIVQHDSMQIQVLGTQFNVMAYEDEESVQTTLVQGSVKVTNGNEQLTIKPSAQAILNKTNGNLRQANVDVEKFTGWRSGTIEFQDDDLPYIMRQIARWYNINFVFEGKVPVQKFSGSIRKQATLNKSLEVLKAAGVSFQLSGKTLKILSAK